jgi:hypothetical protein
MASLLATTKPPPLKKKGKFKALKSELLEVKEKWGSGIKLFWKTPGPPWPVRVTRIIGRTPEAQAYDVDEIRVRLWMDSPDFEQIPVRVEVDSHKTLPKRLANLIAIKILEHWKNELHTEIAMPEHLRSGWLVQNTFDWCEEQFGSFLQLQPSMIESYLGFDDQGMTSRRFTIVESQQLQKEKESAGETKTTVLLDDRTEEQKQKDEERRKRKALERQKAADRERELKRVEAERKKKEAQRLRELGVDPSGFKPLSKAEKAEIEARKRGQGRRTAKTGPRASKYAGPGSALEKKSGNKKNKKKN